MLSIHCFLPVYLRSVALSASIFAFKLLVNIMVHVISIFQALYSRLLIHRTQFKLMTTGRRRWP